MKGYSRYEFLIEPKNDDNEGEIIVFKGGGEDDEEDERSSKRDRSFISTYRGEGYRRRLLKNKYF